MANLKIFEQIGSHEYMIKLGIATVKMILNMDIGIEIKSELCYKGVKFVVNKKNTNNAISKSEERFYQSDKRIIQINKSKILNTLIDMDVSKDYDEIMYKELLKCFSDMVYYEMIDQILSNETVMFKNTDEKKNILHDIKIIIKNFIYEINVFKLRETFSDNIKYINDDNDLLYFLGVTQTFYKVVPRDGNVFNRNPSNLALIKSTLPYEHALNKFYKKYRNELISLKKNSEFIEVLNKQLQHRLTLDIIPVIE